MNHKLDTDTQVFFYEQDFYVLSNFSAFNLKWKGLTFPTSEHAYHWEKFPHAPYLQDAIHRAPSAHQAFKLAESHRESRIMGWDRMKAAVMLDILRAKAEQHEYVRRKLLATGNRHLIEDSWRDSYWGWGPDRNGKNMLGILWMEVRSELQSKIYRPDLIPRPGTAPSAEKPRDKPRPDPLFYYQVVTYLCGCEASGRAPLPNYCGTYGRHWDCTVSTEMDGG